MVMMMTMSITSGKSPLKSTHPKGNGRIKREKRSLFLVTKAGKRATEQKEPTSVSELTWWHEWHSEKQNWRPTKKKNKKEWAKKSVYPVHHIPLPPTTTALSSSFHSTDCKFIRWWYFFSLSVLTSLTTHCT